MSRFQGDESIELGADVGHASGDQHAASTRGVLTTFVDTQDAQAGLALGHGRLDVGWRGTRCGPNGPFGVHADRLSFGQNLHWGAGGEGGQVLEQT